MTLLDDWLPRHEFAGRHSAWVAAPVDVVFDAVATTDLASPWVVRLLMGIRAVPAVASAPGGAWRRMREPRGPVTLKRVMGYDFARLEERPGRELVLGLEGRFWTPTGRLVPTDPARFREPLAPGLARAAWSWAVQPEARNGRTGTRLTTETRVVCADAPARASFSRYWRVVRPFSGLIRRSMLRAILREAERRVAAGPRGGTGPPTVESSPPRSSPG